MGEDVLLKAAFARMEAMKMNTVAGCSPDLPLVLVLRDGQFLSRVDYICEHFPKWRPSIMCLPVVNGHAELSLPFDRAQWGNILDMARYGF